MKNEKNTYRIEANEPGGGARSGFDSPIDTVQTLMYVSCTDLSFTFVLSELLRRPTLHLLHSMLLSLVIVSLDGS